MQIQYSKFFLVVLVSFIGSNLIAQTDTIRTSFKYGGYIKLDVLKTWYQNGDVYGSEPIRDFNLPSQIPVGPSDANQTLDFHAKESRFNFDVTTKVNNQKAHAFLELDFLLGPSGNERVTNSFNPRIRHFYFEWDKLLVGQTWSTFMVVVIPDDLDFAGTLEGLVFVRQPQIRYSAGSWVFAVENPETILTPFGEHSSFSTEKEFLPDIVVRKNFDGKWGQWSVSGLFRTLSAKDSTDILKRAPAFGITTGGKLNVGKRGNDIRMTVAYGSGLGRYLAANFIAAGSFDAQNNISPISSFNGYVAYNHFWIQKKLSSSFNVGYFSAFHDKKISGPLVNKSSYAVSANLKYDPTPQMRFGIEGAYAFRERLDDVNGSLYRIQLSAKYRFGYINSVLDEKK